MYVCMYVHKYIYNYYIDSIYICIIYIYIYIYIYGVAGDFVHGHWHLPEVQHAADHAAAGAPVLRRDPP